ncbi:MAG: acyltransferase [Lachnospiraceae bacterium]|nr:acyltransferase [Lachnospiraceae bacterium]
MSIRDVVKMPVLCLRALRRKCQCLINRALFALHGVKLSGEPGVIDGIVRVRRSRNGSISIGRGFSCNSGASYNLISPLTSQRCVLRTIGSGRIEIGEDTGISNTCIVSEAAVVIGNNVMIGGGCRIWDTDFHPLDPGERAASFENPGKSAPVYIMDNAFIGADSIILKGVTVGKRAVIGAGSVLRSSVGDDEVWAGNPAVRIR